MSAKKMLYHLPDASPNRKLIFKKTPGVFFIVSNWIFLVLLPICCQMCNKKTVTNYYRARYDFLKYSRRDLNPHEHYCSLDFKSNVSTNSTTSSKILSERRDLNPRPSPWQGDALPAELLSQRMQIYNNLTYMRSINKLIFTNFCL